MADVLVAAALLDVLGRLLRSQSEHTQLLEPLLNDVNMLKAILKDSVRMQADQLNLERHIKEVIYDVEDTLESCSIMMTSARSTMCNWLTYKMQRDTLKREIESIRNRRLEPLNRRIRSYTDLQVIQKQPTQAIKVPSVLLNKEPPIRIVNIFEDEANSLISCLMENTKKRDVISITGMPGIGKTMLAWKIYQDDMIRYEFPNRIWVDLPIEFSSKDLCLNIVREFTKHGLIKYQELVMTSSPDEEKIISALEYCLGWGRYLLVMDGVWSADSLRSVVDMLPNMGKVLITSSNRSVCTDANATRKPHMLRFLNEKESWELLQLEVFEKVGGCPETLEPLGECIAKKCDGSPLAIVLVASSLTPPTEAAEDLTEKWWKKVSENVTMYLTEYGQQRVFSLAELSYSKLHQRLQDCFLYLGMFPEGCEISVRRLTRLWIAEGFVARARDQDQGLNVSLEEIAEQNLADLIDTNLVMVGKSYPNGQIRTCRLHKLVYGFCKYKAEEKDFYQEIKLEGAGGGPSDLLPISIKPDSRRHCIYSHPSEFLSSAPKGRVHSILCLSKEKEEHPKHSYTVHKRFKFLRILECQCMDFTYFRRNLNKLMLLKYISLSCHDSAAIPQTVSSLLCLETLVVDTRASSIQLKVNIWRMPALRHLVTKAAIVLAIRGGGGGGENLQTLARLAPESCTEDVFAMAPNLKTLGIRGQLASLSSPESLTKLVHLQDLKLIDESAAADHRLPLISINWFPPNLRNITLSATNLEWKWMSVLGKIDSLEILKLKNNAFTGESWNTADADAFRRLGFLFIGTTDLVSWEASADDCFPALECLVLNNCERLRKIPPTLAKSLHTLDVENVSESAVESARAIARMQGKQRGRLHELKLSIRSNVQA